MAPRNQEMSKAQPSLFITVSAWLRKHGKQVKPTLTDEQRHELQQCFKLMDNDGSGAIDVRELNNAFKLLGINLTNKEMKALVDQVDRDHTGDVGWNEFLEIMMQTQQRLAEEPEAAQKSHQLPFALMSTQYRRKRYMDSLLSGTKEGFSAMVRAAEQHQQEMSKAPSHSESRHHHSPPRSPRRASGTPSSPRNNGSGPGQTHGDIFNPDHPAIIKHQPALGSSNPSDRPHTVPAPAATSTSFTAPGSLGTQNRGALAAPHGPRGLSARQSRLHAMYQSWVERGQGKGQLQRKGGGAMRPVVSGVLIGRGTNEVMLKQLLELPQANLDLSFSRPIIKIPRASSSGPTPHTSTAGATRHTSTAGAATLHSVSAPGTYIQQRPSTAPYRRSPLRTQPGSHPPAAGPGRPSQQPFGRPASSLSRASVSQPGQKAAEVRQRPTSACSMSSLSRMAHQARAAADVGQFLTATQLMPERSLGACAREKSWAYADSRR